LPGYDVSILDNLLGEWNYMGEIDEIEKPFKVKP
jgi:hypothetical protein